MPLEPTIPYLKNRIRLSGRDFYDEGRIREGEEGLYPGHLIEILPSGRYQRHSEVGGMVLPKIALEQVILGKTMYDVYPDDDVVFYTMPARGDIFQIRLKAGETVGPGDLLSSGGDGSFIKSTAFNELHRLLSDSTVITDWTTETPFDKNFVIPADTIQVGDVFRIRARVAVVSAYSDLTVTLKLMFGAVTLGNSGAVDIATGDVGWFDFLVTVRSIGATGTLVASGTHALGVPGTVTAKPVGVNSTTLNTTLDTTIAVTATASGANSGNQVVLRELVVERLFNYTPLCQVEGSEEYDNSEGSTEIFVPARFL